MTEYQSNTPLVAIRCVTYNHEPYIRDALEGFVMQQTNFPFVAVVHDDASTDGTAAIIREYAGKYPDIIRPIYETENQYSKPDDTLARIMDAACEATGARYIALCEGDDYWIDPFKLQTQVDFLESHPDYGMCYTKTVSYNQSLKRFRCKPWGGPWEAFEDLVTRSTGIPTATGLVRQELFNRYFAEIKQVWAMGDLPWELFFAINSKIKFLPIVTSVYRVLEKSACHFTNMEDSLKFLHSAIDARKFFARLSGREDLFPKIIMNQYNGLLCTAYKYQNYPLAHKYSSISWNDRPTIFLRKLFAKNKLSFVFASKSIGLLRKGIVRYLIYTKTEYKHGVNNILEGSGC